MTMPVEVNRPRDEQTEQALQLATVWRTRGAEDILNKDNLDQVSFNRLTEIEVDDGERKWLAFHFQTAGISLVNQINFAKIQ